MNLTPKMTKCFDEIFQQRQFFDSFANILCSRKLQEKHKRKTLEKKRIIFLHKQKN